MRLIRHLPLGRRRDDRGVAMLEFALIALPLFGLLYGVIEFGWAFNQQQDVRYGSREGARLAAVASANSSTPTAQSIVNAVCSRMDSADSTMHVYLSATPSTGSTATIGDTATIQVWKPVKQITGFYSSLLDAKVIKSDLTFRLEQVPGAWASTTLTPLTQSGGTVSGGLTCP